MLVHQNRTFSVPAFPLEQVHDPTGTGDTFAGGFMGYLASVKRADDAELRRAMVHGSVMGSFTVEKFGVDRLRTLKRHEIHARAKHFYKMTQFTLQSLRGGGLRHWLLNANSYGIIGDVFHPTTPERQ
jgi:hypothetical protein